MISYPRGVVIQFYNVHRLLTHPLGINFIQKLQRFLKNCLFFWSNHYYVHVRLLIMLRIVRIAFNLGIGLCCFLCGFFRWAWTGLWSVTATASGRTLSTSRVSHQFSCALMTIPLEKKRERKSIAISINHKLLLQVRRRNIADENAIWRRIVGNELGKKMFGPEGLIIKYFDWNLATFTHCLDTNCHV